MFEPSALKYANLIQPYALRHVLEDLLSSHPKNIGKHEQKKKPGETTIDRHSAHRLSTCCARGRCILPCLQHGFCGTHLLHDQYSQINLNWSGD